MSGHVLKPIGVIHTGVPAPSPHEGPPLTLDERLFLLHWLHEAEGQLRRMGLV